MTEGQMWRPPATFDEFRILRPVGSGGMGSVYLAEDTALRRRVAIKFIRSSSISDVQRQRFVIEARAAAKLTHPNLMAVYRFGEVDGHPYIASEYVEGSPLRQLQLPIPYRRALEIAIGLSRGLAAAHEAGVLHRDIKPGNAVLTADGSVKLIDFGLAKLFHDQPTGADPTAPADRSAIAPGTEPAPGWAERGDDTLIDERTPVVGSALDEPTVEMAAAISDTELVQEATPTRAGTVVGTPKYMAVEVLYGEPASKQSDVYSLGCVLFELSTGAPPPSLASHRISESFDSTNLGQQGTVPDTYAAIVERCLAFRAQDRYPSAVELCADLDRLAAQTARVSRPAETAGDTGSIPGNLPARGAGYATAFFGRTRDMDQIERSISAGARLITLRGPGGTGKTRLAREFAASRAAGLGIPGGAWFANANGTRSALELAMAVAEALSVDLPPTQTEEDVIAAVGWALAGRGAALVILDNLEQVIEPARPAVGKWLSVAPDTRLLVTSRIALELEGETLLDVDSLPVPAEGETSPERVELSEAVQLFIDRAKRAVYGFEINPSELLEIGEIVRQVDGLPLAIELAAARCDILSPAQIGDRLDKRFRLLRGRARGSDLRHQTMESAIGWSWDLLSEVEKSGLAQCAVFRGSFDLGAAEAILDVDEDVLDLLQALAGYSLLRSERRSGAAGQQFSLLENIRAFADEKLTGDERGPAHSRHADHYLKVGGELASAYRHGGVATVLDELAPLRDNLLAVAERAIRERGGECGSRALEAVAAVAPILEVRGPQVLLAELLDRTLAGAGEAAGGLVALAHFERGRLLQASDLEGGLASLDEAIARADRAGDSWLVHRARAERALVLRDMGRLDEAAEELASAARYATEVGDGWLEAYAIGNRGMVELFRGNSETADRDFRDAVSRFERGGDLRHAGFFFNNLALVAGNALRLDEARDNYLRARDLWTSIGDRRLEAGALCNLACVALEQDDLDRSAALFAEARSLAQQAGDQRMASTAQGELGRVAVARGEAEGALALFSAAIDCLTEVGDHRFALIFSCLRGAVEASRDRLAAAETSFAVAAELAEELTDPALNELLDVTRGHLDLGRARAAHRQGRDGTPHLLAARARVERAREHALQSDYARTALEHLAAVAAATEAELA